MGDNLYPAFNGSAPKDWEFNKMLSVFKKDYLKDLPIYPIRGNHDCYYRREALLELGEKDASW